MKWCKKCLSVYTATPIDGMCGPCHSRVNERLAREKNPLARSRNARTEWPGVVERLVPMPKFKSMEKAS